MEIDSRVDFDRFEDVIIFWISLSEPTQSNIVEQAKRIDGNEYLPTCYGTCVSYDIQTREYKLDPDERDTDIYYIDNDGNKTWFLSNMSRQFQSEIFTACERVLMEKTNIYKTNRESSRDSR